MPMNWTSLAARDQSLKYLSALTTLDGIDPQVVWADLTFFQYSQLHTALRPVSAFAKRNRVRWQRRLIERGYLSPEIAAPRAPIPVIFELKHDATLTELLHTFPLDIRPLGEANVLQGRRIYSAFVASRKLAQFASAVLRWRVGLVNAPVSTTFTPGAPPNSSSLPNKSDIDKTQTVVGVIDHGVPFANPIYNARIERFWNQQYGVPVSFRHYDAPPGFLNLKPPRHFSYGWEMDQTMLAAARWWTQDETDAYRPGWVNYCAAQGSRSHAAHVLGVLAGKSWFDEKGTHGSQELNDYASYAPIIAVQLPASPTKDTSGNTLCVHVFNAVNYVLQQASGRPVVINLSDGSYAGPHDGSSLLERGIDELLIAYRKQHGVQAELVVAAGNQFHEAIHWNSSIENGNAKIAWRILPDDTTDGCLEVWFEKNQNLDKVKVAVTSPSGVTSSFYALGHVAVANDTAGAPAMCLNFSRSPPNAVGRSCVVVHWGPTNLKTSQLSRGKIEHGIWHMHLTCEDTTSNVPFNAYIERDDPAFGDPGPRRQAFFEHLEFRTSFQNSMRTSKGLPVDDVGNGSPIRRLGALNSIATAAQVRVAGALTLRPFSLSPYSAGGPGRNGHSFGVDSVAVADDSLILRGVLSSGVRSGSVWRMNGTSVAAPKMARALVNRIANGHYGWPTSGSVPVGPLERHGGHSIP